MNLQTAWWKRQEERTATGGCSYHCCPQEYLGSLYAQHPEIARTRTFIWKAFSVPDSSWYATVISYFFLLVILLSTTCLCVQTLPHLQDAGKWGAPHASLRPCLTRATHWLRLLRAVSSARFACCAH